MAKNSNEALKPRHTLFVATTGGGKTTALRQCGQLAKAKRIALFDPYCAHDKIARKTIIKTYSLKEFAYTLAKTMNQKKPFAVSLCGVYGVAQLDMFARILWQLADGHKELHVAIEELAASVKSPNSISPQLAELWNGGRQFGLVMYSIFQRAQEVPKVIVRKSRFKWIGMQDSKADCKYWSVEIDIPTEDIFSLVELEYFLKETGKSAIRGKLRNSFKKIT